MIIAKMSMLHFLGISMPPIMRKRGRPKGHEVTVIGLPAKKSKTKQASTDHKEKVIPFIKLHTSVRERGMLNLHDLLWCGILFCCQIY